MCLAVRSYPTRSFVPNWKFSEGIGTVNYPGEAVVCQREIPMRNSDGSSNADRKGSDDMKEPSIAILSDDGHAGQPQKWKQAFVTPAEAGVHCQPRDKWIPASAGMM